MGTTQAVKTLEVAVYADETDLDALVRCLKENIRNGNLDHVADEVDPELRVQQEAAVNEAAALLKVRRSDFRDRAVNHYLNQLGRNGNMTTYDLVAEANEAKRLQSAAKKSVEDDERKAEAKRRAKLDADLKAAEQPGKDALAAARRYAADQRRREAEGKAFVKAHADSRANRVKG